MGIEFIPGDTNRNRAALTGRRMRRCLPARVTLGMLLALIVAPLAEAQTADQHVSVPPFRETSDELGRKVRVPREASRVVSLAPNLTEIVFALNDGDHLAGDTDYCDYPPEALRKPHVGGMVNPSLEHVAALMPDLVLATKAINRRETVDALEGIGLSVYVTDAPRSVDAMIGSVEHIGDALGIETSAAALAANLRARLADLDRRLSTTPPRRVLFVVWPDPLISVGRDTFIADAMRRAGGNSVVETSAEWPHVSLEDIVHLQPEVLIFASAHGGNTQPEIDALRTRPGWKDLAAVQHGKIVVVSDAINRPAPRLVDAIESLARSLHPDVFSAADTVPDRFDRSTEEACSCAR